MGLDFHVVRCSTCQSFQVQQVKKENKWSCKLCGEKQSLLKEFGRGSGADCRRHVQKLNVLRGAVMEEQDTWSLWKQVEADGRDVPEQHNQVERTGLSRWSKYMDTPEEAEPEEVEELMDRQQLHGNNMIDSEDHPSPPRKKSIRLPSLGSGPVSRWACFLQTDRQEQGEEPAVSGRSQSVGGATSLSCNDIISQASFLPSMFDSGEDFSLDF